MALLSEQVARQAFELDAAHADVDLGIGATWHDLETTAFDGTTAELFSNDVLAGGVRRARGRHETQGPHRHPCPHWVPPLDRRGGRG
jgi:hypothetical protein